MKSPTYFIDLRGAMILVICWSCMTTSCSDDDAPQDIPLVISGISPSSGPKNTLVTITGNGFSALYAEDIVTLNGKICPVTSASITELKVTIPAEGGSGKLVVKVNDKTAETPEFTYILSPDEIPLIISGISPLSGPKNTVVTITGTGFGPTAAENIVTLNDVACPVISASPTELKVTIPAKAGSGKLMVNVSGKVGETPLFTYVYQVTITTIAGSTQGVGDKFDTPVGLQVDNDGNINVADYENHQIKKVTPEGGVSLSAGSTQGDGDKFDAPTGIAIDTDGNIYVADTKNHKVKKISPYGGVSTIAGSTKGDGDKFSYPTDVAIDSDGNIYVSDYGNHKIKKITPSGDVSTVAGSTAGDGEKFSFPWEIALDKDGNIYVADRGNHKIKKISSSGDVITVAGSTKGDGDKFNGPIDVAVDGSGNVYVADYYNHKIKKITSSGVVSTLAGSTKGDGNKFNNPSGVAVDSSDNIYVSDGGNHKIKKIVQE